jgi:hypothetical protein
MKHHHPVIIFAIGVAAGVVAGFITPWIKGKLAQRQVAAGMNTAMGV